MTCPSTGHIHALRVPPDVESAKEAIRWINWDRPRGVWRTNLKMKKQKHKNFRLLVH